jgi:hypothetical protein
MARLLVPQQHIPIIEMIGPNLLFYAEEATGETVEEDVEVLSLVDLTARAARLAVRHESGGGLEVFEAHGAFHASYAVIAEDVLV